MEEIKKEFLSLNLIQKSENILISSSEGKIREICVVKATNRQILINYINALMSSYFFPKHPDASYLRVALSGEKLGCSGGSVDYKTEADVPNHSVPCPCGNPKHWLIKYEQE